MGIKTFRFANYIPRLVKQIQSLVMELIHGQKKNISELVWLAVGQCITLLLSIVSIKFITSIGTQDYGIFILLLSITTIFAAVYYGPFEHSYVRYLFEYCDREEKKRFFLRKFLSRLFKSLAVVFTAFVLLLMLWNQLSPNEEFVSIAAIMVILLPLANQPLTGMLNALRLRREVAIIQIAEKALQVGTLIVFAFFSKLLLSSVLWAVAIAFSCFFLVRLYILYLQIPQVSKKVIQDYDAPLLSLKKDISSFMRPFIVWGVFAGLQNNGERWILGSVLSTSDVGRYGLAFSLIASTVIVVYIIISQFMTPLIYESFSLKTVEGFTHGKKLIQLFRWTIIISVVFFAAVFGIYGDAIISVISADEYHVGGWFLFCLTAGIGLFHIAQVETTIGFSLRKSKIYILPKVLTSTCSILLYFLGCIYAGLLGTAVAAIIVNVGFLISVVIINKQFSA